MTTFPTFEIFKRDGSRIEFTSAFSTDDDAAAYLHPRVIRGEGFAASLLSQLASRGRLSETQWAWVHKLATDQKARDEKPRQPRQPRPATHLGGIRQLIDRAFEAGKKFPRIDVRTAEGQRVVFARSGELSKSPGAIRITDGRPFGANTYFGSIDLDGNARLTRNVTDDVRELLVALDANPAAVGAQHGVATGNCCFCQRDLTTKESRSVGYGPICAEKFGLPWGEVSPEVEAAHLQAQHIYPEGHRYHGD